METYQTQIILIRPGSTEYDQQGRIRGNLDIPLSEQGQLEISQTATELKDQEISCVYATSCQVAQETGRAIADALDIKYKTLDKLKNLDHGLWQGMLVDEVKKKQPKVYRQWQEQPEITCPPEGEMLADATQRIQQAMGRFIKKHKNEVIALVAPDPIASLIRSLTSNENIGDLWQSAPCGSWELFSISSNVVTLGA